MSTKSCSLDDCNKVHHAKGFCQTHYRRLWKNGNPHTVLKAGMPSGGRLRESHPLWAGDDISYNGAHRRVRRMRGAVSNHACEFCGDSAKEWAYTHMDPCEKYEANADGYQLPYSPDPQFYIPLCKPCHGRFDRQKLGVAAR